MTNPPELPPGAITIEAEWEQHSLVPIVHVDTIQMQTLETGETIVTVGQVHPPLYTGSPEEVREKISNTPSVTIHVLARMELSPQRLQEFAKVFADHAARIGS